MLATITPARDQCCLISGESGAGKTESAKYFLAHLLSFEVGAAATAVEHKILESQPILEAFGNAKTALNNNSSRFGKYIEVIYRNGAVCGARIQKYLLEKSRVVRQLDKENNFHVLHYLIEACLDDIRERVSVLRGERDYQYFSGAPRNNSKGDKEMYTELMTTFKAMGFTLGEIDDIHVMCVGSYGDALCLKGRVCCYVSLYHVPLAKTATHALA